MPIRVLCLTFILLTCSFSSILFGQVSTSVDEREERLLMRQVGNAVLGSIGDESTRVLPITKEGERFVVGFAKDISFDPGVLAQAADSILGPRYGEYHVEVVDCERGSVVHSYESVQVGDGMACSARTVPAGCYRLLIGMDEPLEVVTASSSRKEARNIAFVVFALLCFGIFAFVRSKGKERNDGLIQLGRFKFDVRNMHLSFQKKRTELTGKEVELLYLLYTNANSTVERNVLMKEVWGEIR